MQLSTLFVGKGSHFIYWVRLTHRSAGMVNIFFLSQSQCQLYYMIQSFGRYSNASLPNKQQQPYPTMISIWLPLWLPVCWVWLLCNQTSSFSLSLHWAQTWMQISIASLNSLVLLFLSGLSFLNSSWHFYHMQLTYSLENHILLPVTISLQWVRALHSFPASKKCLQWSFMFNQRQVTISKNVYVEIAR